MTFEPLYMRNVDLILGDEATGENFKCQLRSVTLTPDTNITRIKTLCPTGQFANVDDPEWNLELGYLYGRETAADKQALARFLLDNSGAKIPFSFRPWSGEEDEGYKGVVTCVPGAMGGEQGGFSEQSVSLPVEGQPLPLDADGASGLVVQATPSAADPMTADVTTQGATEPVTADYGDASQQALEDDQADNDNVQQGSPGTAAGGETTTVVDQPVGT